MSESRGQVPDASRAGSPEPRQPRAVVEERWNLLRSTWILNPGIPHFVDFPPRVPS